MSAGSTPIASIASRARPGDPGVPGRLRASDLKGLHAE